MKKYLVMCFIITILLFCSGCVSQAEYDALKSENRLLSQQVEELEAQVEELATPIPTATPQMDAIKAISDITITVYEPNSADGVDVGFAWYNNSFKTIKYITFIVTPYNAVGDQVSCDITDRSTTRLKITGPNSPKEMGYCTHEAMWYNGTIDSCVLEEIMVEYTDGTTLDIPQSAIETIGVTYEHAENKY